jgi:hypothetical protein
METDQEKSPIPAKAPQAFGVFEQVDNGSKTRPN